METVGTLAKAYQQTALVSCASHMLPKPPKAGTLNAGSAARWPEVMGIHEPSACKDPPSTLKQGYMVPN